MNLNNEARLVDEIGKLRKEVERLKRVEVPLSGGGGGVTDHGALTGLLDNDHPQYSQTTHDHAGTYLPIAGKAADADKLDNIDSSGFVQTSGNQTVGGVKTFSSIPVLPETNPTLANQAVRKGYADAAYLSINGKAADSDKLDGLDSTEFVKTSGTQTIADVKTFSSIPVLPASNPTTSNQAVRKGYADAAYLGISAKAADSDKLDGLNSTDFGRPVFLTTALTSTAWDGDAFSNTSKTKIDLSSVFSVPAGVKAVLVKVALRDSASASGLYYVQFSGVSSGTNYSLTVEAPPVNDRFGYGQGIVPCDANGDIYYNIIASGSGTMDIYLEIWGYWL